MGYIASPSTQAATASAPASAPVPALLVPAPVAEVAATCATETDDWKAPRLCIVPLGTTTVAAVTTLDVEPPLAGRDEGASCAVRVGAGMRYVSVVVSELV